MKVPVVAAAALWAGTLVNLESCLLLLLDDPTNVPDRIPSSGGKHVQKSLVAERPEPILQIRVDCDQLAIMYESGGHDEQIAFRQHHAGLVVFAVCPQIGSDAPASEPAFVQAENGGLAKQHLYPRCLPGTLSLPEKSFYSTFELVQTHRRDAQSFAWYQLIQPVDQRWVPGFRMTIQVPGHHAGID
jgi:hypothetical protein